LSEPPLRANSARMRNTFSICIPAFNRPAELRELLNSLVSEAPGDWEILISEDCSPRQAEITEAVKDFVSEHPYLSVRFLTTPANLGYDGNLRFLIDNAFGRYCVFMGDDDIWCPGALNELRRATNTVPGLGVILRAWRTVSKCSGQVLEEHRYFAGDRLFTPGPTTVAAFFRRSIFISGLTILTEAARAARTERFDGTLLYQLHLAGNVLMTRPGYYVSQVTAFRRAGGEHYFGSSERERGRFAPRQLSPDHSLNFVRGLLEITRSLERNYGHEVGRLIRSDLGRYSYPLLAIQARSLSRAAFQRYASALSELGFGQSLWFGVYRAALTLGGVQRCDVVINMLKRLLGSTPVLTGAHGSRLP